MTTRYKYVFNGFDYDELYDLRDDPAELHNLIDEPAHAGTRAELRGKLYELMNRFGDPYGDVGDAAAGGGDRPNRYGAPRYLPRA
jgi:arylsulfatase A-like enzyme